MSDEYVEAKELMRVSEETMQLKQVRSGVCVGVWCLVILYYSYCCCRMLCRNRRCSGFLCTHVAAIFVDEKAAVCRVVCCFMCQFGLFAVVVVAVFLIFVLFDAPIAR